MIEYLESNHKEQVIDILNAESLAEIPFPAIEVNLVKLKEENKKLFDKVVYRDNIWSEQIKWTESLELTQKKILDTFEGHSKEYSFVKNLFPVTFINHPSPGLSWSHDKIFELVEVTANVIKTSDLRKKEAHREYRCTKCKETTTIEANRHHDFYFEELNKCTISRGCTGTMINTAANDEELDLDRYIDFQIILVKTLLSSSSKGEDLKVELDEEYTDKCRVGDQVTILGVIETRSEFGMNSFKLVLRAASLKVHQVGQSYTSTDLFEINCEIYDMWDKDKNKYNGDEAVIRDEMVSSVAPELQGLAMIKFGLLLTLCSGGSDDQNESPQTQGRQNIKFREICHLLMIGDPGLGKSQILRAACNISLISQQTVGYSATAAGLIGGIYKEDGNDHVEGGALVKANNGICAIDEFNLMPKEHRSSIHEAMEHQVVSFKKASTHMTLPAKCSIVASMNQKNASIGIESSNLSIEQSLVSRFDLVFDLEDPKDPDFTKEIVQHIFETMEGKNFTKWSIERLQKHIMIAKDIIVTISDYAQQVLSRYFVICKNNINIEPGRRTMRLLTSLQRLTKCHTKLMLRTEALIEDALIVIMVMEQTWSFGHLIKKRNNVVVNFPLNLNQRENTKIMRALDLEDLWEEYLGSKFKVSTNKNTQKKPSQKTQPINIDDIFSFSSNHEQEDSETSEIPNQSTNSDHLYEPLEDISFTATPDSEKSLQSNLDQLCFALGSETKTEEKTEIKAEKSNESKSDNRTFVSKLKKFQYESQSQSQTPMELSQEQKSEKQEVEDDFEFDIWGAIDGIETSENSTKEPKEKENVPQNILPNEANEVNENEVIDIDNFDIWGEL